MVNPDRLLVAIQVALQDFFAASSVEEIVAVLQKYPELLEEELDPVFEEVIENARKGGTEAMVEFFTQRHQSIKLIRPKLSQVLAQQRDVNAPPNAIQQALDAEPDTELSAEYIEYTDGLLEPVNAYLHASNLDEVIVVFNKYPELLGESLDYLFESIVTNALKYGENEIAQSTALRHQELKSLRQKLKETILSQEATLSKSKH